MPKANSGYSREKEIAPLLDMDVVPGSGNNWEKGKEDIVGRHGDPRIGQIKSTGKRNTISVCLEDLSQLCNHGLDYQKDYPLFILDFTKPEIVTPTVTIALPEPEIWIAIPRKQYMALWRYYYET